MSSVADTITQVALPITDDEAEGIFYVFAWALHRETDEVAIAADEWSAGTRSDLEARVVERSIASMERSTLALRLIHGAQAGKMAAGVDLSLVAAECAEQLGKELGALAYERAGLRAYLAGDKGHGFGRNGEDPDSIAVYQRQIASWEANVSKCRAALNCATTLANAHLTAGLAVAA